MEFHRSELFRTNSGQITVVSIVGMVRYNESARQLVANLKYHQQKSVALDIAMVMAEVVHVMKLPDCVTWIPTTDGHRVSRGFDHAELIARHMGALIGCPALRLLRRTSTHPQTGLPREARLGNVSFIGSPRAQARRVWVIDDVWTTGASFRAATTALLDSGAASIGCVAFTHVA
jgi:predicted amidophosphoribosyltransferase